MNFDKKEIIGMIHLAGPDTIEKAMDEIKIYEEEGLSGIIIENYHGRFNDVINVLEALKLNPTTLDVGVNILPNDFESAFDICNRYDFIKFIQLDYISGTYIHNKEEINLDITQYLTLSAKNADIKVYGGVWPKYYTTKEGSQLNEDIAEALMLCEGIVVTGTATGAETPIEKIKEFREVMNKSTRYFLGRNVPLIIGAGLTAANVGEQLKYAQGAIVGSAFKPNGRTHQMVDRDLVRQFMDEVKKIENGVEI